MYTSKTPCNKQFTQKQIQACETRWISSTSQVSALVTRCD